ncbi:MAG: class I SAM-dependent methyltransferase, partial [Solirubrobacteraceae bacterium]
RRATRPCRRTASAGAIVNYERLYEFRFRDVDQRRRDDVWNSLAPMLHERLGRPRRVLDPAAGRCEFINAVPAEERWAVDAVAYEEGVVAEGTKVIVSEIMAAELPSEYFGGIFVSNFLEHLPDQETVAAFLEKMRGCLAPGGRIAVMGPNFRYCYREYFDFADHTVVLTEKGVEEHLYAAGFEICSVDPRFLPYTFTGRLPSHPALVRTYLRFPVAWRILGKQFLLVAEREDSKR